MAGAEGEAVNSAAFYKTVRAKLGALSASQVAGFDTILPAIAANPLSFQAYMLATTWHETGKTMQPVREAFNLSEDWRRRNLRYYPWYGRGYVQLTWQANYDKADSKLARAGLIKAGALLANPDLAMRPDLSAYILNVGMVEGWFSGKKLSNYLPSKGTATRDQYIRARWIINIQDKADLIEDYAQVFERALLDGGVV